MAPDKVTHLKAPQDRIDMCRRIVDNWQYEKFRDADVLNGTNVVTMDATTANMVVTVYDALKPENQERYISRPMIQMVDIGWQLVK